METRTNSQLSRGHTFSGIFTQDNARVHLGDVHSYGESSNHSHNYYFCASSSQQTSQSLTFCGHGPPSGEAELLSLKRRRSPDENEYTHRHNKEEPLEQVLVKLGKFSKSIQDQRIGKDAKKIVRRIALALDAIKQQAGPTKPSKWRGVYTNHDEDDFENVDNCLSVAKRVDINTDFQRTKHTKLTRVTRKLDQVTLEQCEISLRTSTFEFRNEDGTEVIESFSSLYLNPRLSGSEAPITVRFGETTMHAAVSFINPVVLAYRVVPSNSEVFKLVRNDDLAGLVAILAEGKATLRDCGERAQTLLHHACDYGSARCCQYLVDKGADIERVSTRTLGKGHILHDTPLLSCVYNDGSRPRRDAVQCGKILLKSGADPTFANDGRHPPVLAVIGHSPALLDSLLVEGMNFLDLKNFRYTGRSLWLHACGSATESAPSILQRLVDAGCDIAKKDYNGWNCLFHSVLESARPDASYECEKLRYLLSIFDDIHARDEQGLTIFDRVDNVQTNYFGSYPRDLWCCALERAGLDVSSHLVKHPRVPSYKMRKYSEYTPEHYHALKHLQSWNKDNFRSQMDRLLQEIPLDEDEALEMDRLRRKKLEEDFDV